MTDEPAASRIRKLAATIASRVLLAALLTALTMAAALGAMFVSTAPRIVSLAVEPLSLLLMPGLVADLLFTGPNDVSPLTVAAVATGFYFVFFYAALWWLDRAKRARRISR